MNIFQILGSWICIALAVCFAWYLMQQRINKEEREREEDEGVL